jgi:6-phosphogluconolactonase (cycloisomerase 2 family)
MLALAVWCVLPGLAGCAGFFVYPGSSTSSSSSGNYVYVANATTDTVAGFTIGAGSLTAVTNSPYTLAFSPTALAINPADSILYVAGNSEIYAYSIGSGGVLTALNSGGAVALVNVVSMDISPDGQWLFVLDGNGVSIDEYQINSSTGVLTQVTGAAYSITDSVVVPHALKVSPSGTYVFASLGTAGDLVFSLNESTGAIASVQRLQMASTTTSDNAVAVDPSGNYLYLARSGTSGGLAVYSVASNTGALSAVSGSPFSTGNQPYAVSVNTAGTAVYVANRQDSTITGYSIASGAVLKALTGSPYTSGSAVAALAVDKTDAYLLAASNGGSPDLTLYTFDTTTAGKLDLTATTTTGTDPTGAVAIATTK